MERLIKKITKEGEFYYQAAQAQSAGVDLLDHELKGPPPERCFRFSAMEGNKYVVAF